MQGLHLQIGLQKKHLKNEASKIIETHKALFANL